MYDARRGAQVSHLGHSHERETWWVRGRGTWAAGEEGRRVCEERRRMRRGKNDEEKEEEEGGRVATAIQGVGKASPTGQWLLCSPAPVPRMHHQESSGSAPPYKSQARALVDGECCNMATGYRHPAPTLAVGGLETTRTVRARRHRTSHNPPHPCQQSCHPPLPNTHCTHQRFITRTLHAGKEGSPARCVPRRQTMRSSPGHK